MFLKSEMKSNIFINNSLWYRYSISMEFFNIGMDFLNIWSRSNIGRLLRYYLLLNMILKWFSMCLRKFKDKKSTQEPDNRRWKPAIQANSCRNSGHIWWKSTSNHACHTCPPIAKTTHFGWKQLRNKDKENRPESTKNKAI